MAFHGPEPLETDAASFAIHKILINLQRQIRDELKEARTDGVHERAVVCLRELLEAFPDYRFTCHPVDVQTWRSQYFEWPDAIVAKIRQLKAKDKERLRKVAAQEFDRLLKLSRSKTAPLGDR